MLEHSSARAKPPATPPRSARTWRGGELALKPRTVGAVKRALASFKVLSADAGGRFRGSGDDE